MNCPNCGTNIQNGNFCTTCGTNVAQAQQPVNVNNYINVTPSVSPKSRLTALLLYLFLGGFAVHRFYVGKVGTGILYLLTAGLFGIGYIIDFIQILCGNFKDSNGLPLENWN